MAVAKDPHVYMLASKRNGALYVGVTLNLSLRIWQHKEGYYEGFSKQFGTRMLVWYERHQTMEEAIAREKVVKRFRRLWKVNMIERMNPEWNDLSSTFLA